MYYILASAKLLHALPKNVLKTSSIFCFGNLLKALKTVWFLLLGSYIYCRCRNQWSVLLCVLMIAGEAE